MRKTTFAWPLLLAMLLLIPLSLAAQNLPGGSAFTVTRDSGDGIQISFQLPAWELESVERDGATLSRVRVDGIPNLFIGEEETLPVFSAMVAIPWRGGVSLRDSGDPAELRSGVQLDFAAALAAERQSGRLPEKLYPAAPALISEPMLLRDFRVVSLNVHPFQWDSATGELLVRESLTLNLDFDNGPSVNETTPALSLSPAFAKIYPGLILNYQQLLGRDGLEYSNPRLLVIYGNFSDAIYLGKVNEYVTWKRQKGFLVNAVSTATAGTTSGAIKTYIQGLYDNPDTRPDYISIIGDAGTGNMQVPSNDTYHDYNYTWLAGGDNLGDAAIGRISVETTEHLQNYMAKINSLEININPDAAAWLDRMLLVGDTASSGISTIYTNEYIHDRSLEVNPDYSYTELYNGAPPSTSINAAINQGVAFYNYRGYINMSGWPSTMGNMANGNRLFHAVFITCSTGSFGGGTATTESVVRHGTEASLGGAVTAIGMATSSTHTPMNNCLDVGIFHGIYPLGMRNMSEAMLYGKLYLYAVYGVSNTAQANNFSGFCNLIGDPTAPVYVGIPETFSLSAPASVPTGTTNLEVGVKDAANQPVAGASVVLTNSSGQQIALAFSDATGLAYLDFAALTGAVSLTVNKDDFKPQVQTITLNSSGGLAFEETEIDDYDSGNGDNIANPGENLDLYFWLRNTGAVATGAFSGTLSCNDPYVVPVSNPINFASISPNATGVSSAVGMEIRPNCPDQHRVVLTFTHAGGQIAVPMLVSGGRLEIVAHSFVGSPGNLVNPGDSWPLTFTLANSGGAPLTNLTGTLSSLDTFFAVSDAQGAWGNLASGASATNSANTFTISARNSCLDGMVIPLQLDLTATDFAQSIPLTFTLGQTSVTDPLGQDAYGYFIFDAGDTSYDQCPTYNWIGIAPAEGGSGTALSLSDPGNSSDEGDQVGAVAIQTVNLPFSFKYYGVDYSQASISSNGFIAFGATNDADWRNWRLPDAGGPSPMVAVFWDDLDLVSGSSYVYTWYNSALHYYVVEWYNLYSGYDGTTQQTFQAILYDPLYYPTHTGDGQIKLQYKVFNNIDLGDGDSYPHGNYATIGIEDHTSTVGLEYTFGNTWPTAAAPLDNESALFITTRPIIPDYPYLVLEQIFVHDANANGHLEPGESSQLNIRLGNRGLVDATNVSAVLSSADPYVTVTTANATYGTVPAQGSAYPSGNYAVSVAPTCPADHQLTFTLAITSATGSWNYNFPLTVVVPELSFSNPQVSDPSGNQNGILDPGETAVITIHLNNIGVIPSPAGTATLSCSTPGISVTDASDSFTSLAAGAYATLSFELSASAAMTQGTLVTLGFNALAGSTSASHSEYLEVGAPLEVVIGAGTSTQNYPLDRYYNYSAHEAIYLASEIATAGTLKALAFQKASGTDVDPIAAVSIYLKHTTASSISAGDYSLTGYTLVYSGAFPNTAASGWMEVDLNPMFFYDGASNLSVLTVKGFQQYISGYPQWTYSAPGGNRARQNRSDSAAPTNLMASTYLPNLRLKVFPDYDVLLPPQNLTAVPGNGFVNLSWEAPATGSPISYQIYRNNTLLVTVTGLNHTDTAVVNETTYSYHLIAIYDGGASGATPTVQAMPTAVVVTEAIIGSGTASSGTSEACPINEYYESLHGQSVYTAAELNSAGVVGPIVISSIGFNVTGLPSLAMPNYVVRMGHTSASNVDAWISTGLTQVWSSASYQPTATGWNMFTLTTPFTWNGSDNLLVDTAFGDIGDWNSSGTTQFTEVTSGYRYVREDNSDQTNIFTGGSTSTYRPNLKLLLVPDEEPELLPPTNLSASASHGYARLNWGAPASGTPDGYKVYRDGSLLISVTGLTHTDLSVTDGTTYQYGVSAVYAGGESVPAGPVSATPNTQPPTNLTALPGNAVVNLSWSAASGRGLFSELASFGSKDRDISGYRIYRNGVALTTVAATSYQDAGLSNGTAYSYHVTTLYSAPAGESAPSNTVIATPNNLQTVIIGSGTLVTNGNQNSPLNICNNSVHGQSVYTAAELNAAGIFGPIEIIGLGFNVVTPPNLPLPNFIIRLKHTPATNAAAWSDATGLQTCYTNAALMPVAGGYDLLNFQTPFLWNGTDNLLVDTAFSPVTVASQSGTLQYTSVSSGYRFAWSNSDDQTAVFSGGTAVTRRYNIQLACREAELALDPPSVAISFSGANRLLTWNSVTNATSYQIWWCADPYGTYEALATLNDPLATSYTDTRPGLDRAFYRVTALRP